MAIDRQPSIVFIDEIETLMKRRDGADTFSIDNIKREMLVAMSNIEAKKHSISIIGASNRPYVLDEAFIRRFPLRLHVPPPDAMMIATLLRTVLSRAVHCLSEDDIVTLAHKRCLQGASIAHITSVIRTLKRDMMSLLVMATYFDKVNDPTPFIIALLTAALEYPAERS